MNYLAKLKGWWRSLRGLWHTRTTTLTRTTVMVMMMTMMMMMMMMMMRRRRRRIYNHNDDNVEEEGCCFYIDVHNSYISELQHDNVWTYRTIRRNRQWRIIRWTQKQHIMIPSPPIPSLRCPPIGAMSGHVLTLLAVGDVTAPYTCRWGRWWNRSEPNPWQQTPLYREVCIWNKYIHK